MRRLKMIQQARKEAIQEIKKFRALRNAEYYRLSKRPDEEAIKELALLFLIAATYNSAKRPC